MSNRNKITVIHACLVGLVAAFAMLGGFFLIGTFIFGLLCWVALEKYYRIGREDEAEYQRQEEARKQAEQAELERQLSLQVVQALHDFHEAARMQATVVHVPKFQGWS